MLDYEGSSTELVGSSGAELRHNPLSFQLKTRLLRARAGARERPDIIKKHPLKTSKTHYEKLDVYRIALEFVVTTFKIRDRLPRGNRELQDQFKRASFSIVLNIAEGAGKLKQADKRRYFSIARGSVMECGALFDLFNALSHLSPDEYRTGKLLLTRIGAMLSKLCLQGV
jgi:four helix bundle protein